MNGKIKYVLITLTAGLLFGAALILWLNGSNYLEGRAAAVFAVIIGLALLAHTFVAVPANRLRKRFAALSASTGFALCLYMQGLIWDLFWDNYRFWNEMWWTIQ